MENAESGSGTTSTDLGTPDPPRTRAGSLIITLGLLAALAVGIGIGYVAFADRPAANLPTSEPAAPASSASGAAPKPRPASAESSATASSPTPPAASGGTAKPGGVTAAGSALTTLTAMPVERALGFVKLPEPYTGAVFSVSFLPYGWMPDSNEGARLIARVTSVKAVSGQTGEFYDFTGQDVTLYVAPSAAGSIKRGGPYSGTVEIKPMRGRGALTLTMASAQK